MISEECLYIVIYVQGIPTYLLVQATLAKYAFPDHNISNAKYKEILIIIDLYKYTFGLEVVGG